MLNRFREMLSNSLVGLGEFNNSQKSLCKRKSISLVAAHLKILKLLESYRPKIWNLFDEKTVWALFKVDSICFLKKYLCIYKADRISTKCLDYQLEPSAFLGNQAEVAISKALAKNQPIMLS